VAAAVVGLSMPPAKSSLSIYERTPKKGFNAVAETIGIGKKNTFVRVRRGANCDKDTASKISNYYNVPLLTAFERKCAEKPLSASYVSKLTYTLSALFTACVKNNILLMNPVANAIKPRVGEMDVPAYLDNVQMPIFLNALQTLHLDSSVRVSLYLMLMLGLRSGEARGLRWNDIDFDYGIISIEKNAGKTRSGLQLTELKTKRSRRKLELTPFLRDVLLRHKELQEEYAASLGSQWKENGVICPNTFGGLMCDASPNKAVKRIIAAYKELPNGLHAHSLRHSFVSLLIANGLDATNVAEIAGDTVEIINKHYAHSFAERRASVMRIVGNAFAQIEAGICAMAITEGSLG
jgi:integrase